MTTKRNRLIAIIDDTESTTVGFFANNEETVRHHAHSFYETIFDLPNKGFGPPNLPDDVQHEDFYYSSAVTVYYPKSVTLEVIHDWLIQNSIKFTEDGDVFYYA